MNELEPLNGRSAVGVETLRDRAASVGRDLYAQARERLKVLSEPARRLRSAARRPAQTLAAIVG